MYDLYLRCKFANKIDDFINGIDKKYQEPDVMAPNEIATVKYSPKTGHNDPPPEPDVVDPENPATILYSPRAEQATRAAQRRFLAPTLGIGTGIFSYAMLSPYVKHKLTRCLLSGAAGLGAAALSGKLIDLVHGSSPDYRDK